jgi:SAM-dependent methyltransferase
VSDDTKVAAFRDAVRSRINLQPEHVVLEVGVGTGAFARIIAVNRNNYFGIDISADMLRQAEQFLPAENLTLGDGEDLAALDDGRFDLVCCRNVLKHAGDPDAFLCEMTRVCRPGGTVMLVESCAFSEADRDLFLEVTKITEPSQKPYMLDADYAPLLNAAGLADVHTLPFGFCDRSNSAYLDTFHITAEQKQAVWEMYANAPAEVRERRQLQPLDDEPGFQIWLRWVVVDGKKPE